MGWGWHGDRKLPSGDERIELERKQRLFFKENKSIISVLYMTIIILFYCLISLYLITWLWVTIFSPPDSISTWAIFIILQCWCLVVASLVGRDSFIEKYYEAFYRDYLRLEKMTVAELKDILLKKGLSFTGKKSVLIQKIMDSEKYPNPGWTDNPGNRDYSVVVIVMILSATTFFDPSLFLSEMCCGLILILSIIYYGL